jgi:transcriptional regulator with XRE-family HTH domain
VTTQEPVKRITRYYNAPVHLHVEKTGTGLKVAVDPALQGLMGPQSLIDKLGLGPEVLRLRSAGLSQDEIAQTLKMSRAQIQYWLANYTNLTPAGRASKRGKFGSIFEMGDRLQETFEYLMEKLEELKGTENGNAELEVKILDKILKAIAQAGVLVEKIELSKENQRFREVVLDLLDKEAPGIKAKALKRLAEHSSTIALLRPLT